MSLDFFSHYVFPPLIAATVGSVLIIVNEWAKRLLDKRREKQKYQLWKQIFDLGHETGKLIELKKITDRYPDLIYEMLKDGLIKLDASGNYFMIPREQLNPNPQEERYS